VNYRANVHGFKQLGVEWLVSFSAVGSMRESIKPGDMVIVDQFIDRTASRACSFFGGGLVGHIQFADPICCDLSAVLHEAVETSGGTRTAAARTSASRGRSSRPAPSLACTGPGAWM